MYALVDCASFYANCERVFRPDLRDKPVVVLSNNDGCVVAQTDEVKALQVPSFVPYFKVKDILDKHQVLAFSSNYELYADLSMRVMTILDEFSRNINIYSIDEAFLDMKGDQHLVETGKIITQSIKQQVGLPVRFGAGPTKTLAKLANHIAKKSHKCDGVCVIESPQQWTKIFQRLPVSRVWGIGRRTSKKLAYLNIHSVEDFMQADAKYLRRQFNVSLERTWKELHGDRCFAFHDDIEKPKQIFRTRSFGGKTFSKNDLLVSLATHVQNALKKAREHQLLVVTVMIFIQTSRYAKQPYSNHAVMTLDTPSVDTKKVLNAMTYLLDGIYKPQYAYAKSGVGLIELLEAKNYQHDIFTAPDSQQTQNLMRLIDACSKKGLPLGFGRMADKGTVWKMRRQAQSPRYTTSFDELPIIKI